MVEALSELPLVQYWLPVVMAAAVGIPVYWLALKPGQALGPPTGPAGPPPEAGDPFALGSTSEQRKAFRRRGNPIEILYSLSGHDNRDRTGYVLDRSVGGMLLMVPAKVTPGAMISIRPAKASEVVPWVEIAVRSCRPSTVQQGEFDLGCEFVKSPPYSILLLFG